jgi:hypothetical protein
MSERTPADMRPVLSQSLPLAVVMLALSFLLAIAFQTYQLVRERGNLATISADQEPTMQRIVTLRQQLESLAGDAAGLAAGGNKAAQQAVDELARQNITIRPRAPAP